MSKHEPFGIPGGLPSVVVKDHTAVISLNRPAQHNRIGIEDIAQFHVILKEISRSEAVRSVILTATGKSFCSGYDIAALSRSGGSAGSTAPGADFRGLCDAVQALRQPTICALNGPLYGGAIDLALACDFRVGHENVHMSIPASRLGLHYYGSGMVRYVAQLGLAASRRLLLLGDKFSNEDIRRCGFLDAIVPQDEVLLRALDMANQLASNAPMAVQAMKKSLNEIASGDCDMGVIEARYLGSLASDEFTERLAAYSLKSPAPAGVQ
jgi:enoyl-CoA hydratase/carnithine racemase